MGCGLGYLTRALSVQGRLGRDVQFVGCDMNRALIDKASALAEEESPQLRADGCQCLHVVATGAHLCFERSGAPLSWPSARGVLRGAEKCVGLSAFRHAVFEALSDWLVGISPGAHA
ncbi:MAG: SAM-dependent methyltransferase [Myxococcaceae bacterium]|nr:SAM-dependent methyltransferase [Myxococcaceae bacterium]